jgi:hypothetical protein
MISQTGFSKPCTKPKVAGLNIKAQKVRKKMGKKSLSTALRKDTTESIIINKGSQKPKHQPDFGKWLDSNLVISGNPTLSFPSKMDFSLSSQKTSLLFSGFCKT